MDKQKDLKIDCEMMREIEIFSGGDGQNKIKR